MKLPESFEARMKEVLDVEYEDFSKSLFQKPTISIRLNPLKHIDTFNFEIGESVKWDESGKYVKINSDFAVDPNFYSGSYFVQEASSMFLTYALKQVIDFSKPLKVLDLCADQGIQASLLASLLKNSDLLVINESAKSKIRNIKENILKSGFPNYLISNQDPETFSDLEGFFDVVLVSAPCSEECMIRKNGEFKKDWSEDQVALNAAKQKRILSAAALLVAPGGHLIYSTNTFSPKENIENAKWLTRTLDFKSVSLETPKKWKIVEKENTFQFYPHKTEGEGFFLAVFKQLGSDDRFVSGRIKLNRLPKNLKALLRPWIKSELFDNYEFFTKNDGVVVALLISLIEKYGSVFRALEKCTNGLEIGIFKGNDFIPSHALCFLDILEEGMQKLEVNNEIALSFLKKEQFDSEGLKDGWALITYQNKNLGWIKKIGNRVNNYLPQDWKVRTSLD